MARGASGGPRGRTSCSSGCCGSWLGSGLYRLGRARPSERQALARQYVAEALAGEGELTVTGVELADGGTLRVYLEWHGQTLAVTVETGGT